MYLESPLTVCNLHHDVEGTVFIPPYRSFGETATTDTLNTFHYFFVGRNTNTKEFIMYNVQCILNVLEGSHGSSDISERSQKINWTFGVDCILRKQMRRLVFKVVSYTSGCAGKSLF